MKLQGNTAQNIDEKFAKNLHCGKVKFIPGIQG